MALIYPKEGEILTLHMLQVKQDQQTLKTYLYILTALRTPFGRLKCLYETPISHNLKKKIEMGSEERHVSKDLYGN